MTQDQIIEMAKQAQLCWSDGRPMIAVDRLEAFAQLVAAAERKACVKICEKAWHESGGVIETVEFIEEIEARGNP